jgi:Holliday junction resolvase RusA-like endonuclease
VLTLRGHCPSKKNLWRRGRGQKAYLDRSAQAEIDSLVLQARSAWKRAPLSHPSVDVHIYTRSRRQDRDNIVTTLLDVLVKAGVLAGDNIAKFNGPVTVHPAQIDREERVVIHLGEAA